MSDNKEQNQLRDSFSQYMQRQLRGHQLPPDESCWDQIGQRLRRRHTRLLLISGLWIAGAAVVALLLLVNIPVKEDTPLHHSDIMEELAISEVYTDKLIDTPVIAIVEEKSLHKSPMATAQEKDKPKEVLEIISENNPEKEKEIERENEKEKDQPIVHEKKKKTELPVLTDRLIPLANKTRQKRNWQVSAGLLATSNNSLGNDDIQRHYDMQNPNDGSNWIPSVPDYASQLRPENCDDISYNLPLSFGITVRKDLGRKLSVETGLLYTYLSTNLRKDSPNPIKGKLGLHYLGIPVNLIVDLWDNSKWNVYASGGLMVEKGLRSVYTEHFYRTNTEQEITVKTSISGLQWSLNGSIGVSYRLIKDWSLYAEPRISYFFDNNQPISVRTDKPLTLGFGLGVRFDF